MLVGLSGGDNGIKLTPLGDYVAYVTSILRANWNRTKLGFSSSKLVQLTVSTGDWNRPKSKSKDRSESRE
jgi:hypothetical protein